jgi:hypothetical protein
MKSFMNLRREAALGIAVPALLAIGHLPSVAAAADFETRCRAAGVIKCVSFDSTADLAGNYGSNSGAIPGNGPAPSIDTSIKASGAGSLKFNIPAGSPGSAAGSYFTNFSADLATQFGENSEFYVQFRQRMTPEFVSAGNFKSIIIGTGDKVGCTASQSANGLCYSSCTTLEVVIQHPYKNGYPVMYNSCTGSKSHGPYDAFQQSFNGYDFKMQNARPAPYCLYSQTQAGKQFPPDGNCFRYFTNEWVTFQVHIKTGPRVGDEFENSYVDMWMAREGKPAEPVFAWGPYNLSAGSATENQRYGKVWLLPYSGSEVFPAGSVTWYDELIVSRNKIADPTSGPSPQPPTNVKAQ